MAIEKNMNEEVKIKANGFGRFIWYLSFILLIFIPLFIYINHRNLIVQAEAKIKESDSGIDVQLTKRSEMLTKLVDATKGSMKFEKDLLTQVTSLRSNNASAMSVQDKAKLNSQMDIISRGINIQLEAYPKLMNDKTIIELQSGIKVVEDDIAASRRIYNGNVSSYNAMIQSYPMSVAATDMKRSTKIFFEATEAQKNDVKIDLGL